MAGLDLSGIRSENFITPFSSASWVSLSYSFAIRSFMDSSSTCMTRVFWGFPSRGKFLRRTSSERALQRALSEEVLRKNFPREGKPQKTLVIQVDEESIKERIAKLYERLTQLAELKGVIKFSDLMPERSRPAIVELLLSLLYLDTQ